MQPESSALGAATFAVAITCIDGRTHEALVTWARTQLGVDYVDLVTQPGADVQLSACPQLMCEGIRDRLDVSLGAHAPRAVVIAGHDDCAANPVPPDEHRRQISDAVDRVDGWRPGVPVTGVWIDDTGLVSVVAEGSGCGGSDLTPTG